MSTRAVQLLATLLVLLAGCVAPAPTTDAYAAKATATADAAVSAARTAVLATRAYENGRLTALYLEPTLVDAEETLGSVRTTFSSVQPPDTDAADRLRADLEPLLEDAAAAAADLRIALRRDNPADLRTAADQLGSAADRLKTFSQEHTR